MDQFKAIDFYVKEIIAAFDFQMVTLSPFPVRDSPGVSIAHNYFHQLCRAMLEPIKTPNTVPLDNLSPQNQGKIRKEYQEKLANGLKAIARDETYSCIELMQSNIDAVQEGLYLDQVEEYQQLSALLQYVLSKIREGEFPIEIPADHRVENGQNYEQEPLYFNIKTYIISTNEALHQLLADNFTTPRESTESEHNTNKWLQEHNHQAGSTTTHRHLRLDNFDIITKQKSEAKSLVLLVHGLNGNQEAYWGALPHCLMMDHGNHIDVAKWYYETDLLPKNRFAAAWKRKPRLQEWTKIASCLLDDVLSIQKEVDKEYNSISIVGHSQGGLVSIEAAYQNKLRNNSTSPHSALPITSVCLTDMPTKANLFAKLNRIGTLNSNAHTRLLSSKAAIKEVVETKLNSVKGELPFWQIISSADEILGPAQVPLEGLVHKNHQKRHNWLSDCQNLSYQPASRIDDFIRETILKDKK